MERLWDPSTADNQALRTLPHWWLYGGKLVPCDRGDVETDFRAPRVAPLRCALVSHHEILAPPKLLKLVVALDTTQSFQVIVAALCSRECSDALSRAPLPLLKAIL